MRFYIGEEMLQMNQVDQIKEFQKEEYAEEYQCSYALVQRYVKQYKEAKKGSKGYLELVWAKGEAQADFGEADILEGGVRKTIKPQALIIEYPLISIIPPH